MNLKLLDLNSEADYFLLSNTLFRLVISTISLIKLWLDISNLLSTKKKPMPCVSMAGFFVVKHYP